MSPKEWKINTFGWARLEIVGALANTGKNKMRIKIVRLIKGHIY